MKYRLMMILSLFLLLITPVKAYADGETDKEEINIESREVDGEEQKKGVLRMQICSDYDLMEKDIFCLVIKDSQGDQQTLEINAYDAYFEGKSYELYTDDFSVEGIKYAGVNDNIMKETYACDKAFSIMGSEETTLNLYIGDQQVTYVNKDDLLFGHKKKQEMSEEHTESEEKTMTKETGSTEKAELSYVSTENKDPDKKDVVEKVERKEKKIKEEKISFNANKLLTIVVFGVVGMAAIVLWYKKQDS